jgi:putative transposase
LRNKRVRRGHRQAHRAARRGRKEGDRLPSDLSDGEWERLEPLIPQAKPGGRPRKTDMRSAMNAIFYLLRTGCPWRYLPPEVFPPRSTVYNIFRAFQGDGAWEAIWEELRAALRQRLGREASPSAGVIDSQSLRLAEKGDARKVKQTQWVMTPARR